MRLQLALNVRDIDEAVAYYGKLFNAEPHKRRPGYANFAISTPPLKLVLFEDPHAAERLNHLGVEILEPGQIEVQSRRLDEAGILDEVEGETTCCHATQEKLRSREPQGLSWEWYRIIDDNPDEAPEISAAACCAGEHGKDGGVCCASVRTADDRPMTDPAALTPDAWNDFKSRLSSYVRRRVDPASADDVIGLVLLRLVRHQDTLQAADNPAAWMLRVAANAVADHHRRRAAERRALDAFKAEDGTAETLPEGSESTITEEFAACLIPFIRDLPPDYGEALMLTDIGGLSQAEAARRLGLSVSGMKSRVQRGRAKLKQALLRCCAIETDRWGTVLDYRSRALSRNCSGDC